MLPIALDAMGGDHAPEATVEGARRAVERGVPVILFGNPDRIPPGHGLELRPASEVIGMADEPGSSVRRKKDASITRAAEAVRDGHCSAVLSAGNTGAAMAASLFRLGRLRGVSRPAIATPIPAEKDSTTILLDAGANADCMPEWLVQFAQMGAVYARSRFGVRRPTVGLLSIGEEAGKGNEFTKMTHDLLSEPRWSEGVEATFIGNVEGRDLMSAAIDVVVTDGFTGNVALKTLEGGVASLLDRLAPMLGNDALFADISAIMDPDTYGAAVLLGVKGVSLISHGSSSPDAIANALATAHELASGDLVATLGAALRPEP